MPTEKDISVQDEAYLATIAAEPKMTMDEVGADIDEHGHVPVTPETATKDPFTAKGSLSYALDEALSADTDLEHTTMTRDKNDHLDSHLTNPTDDFRDETKGEVEGITDTPHGLIQPIESNKVGEGLEPTIQQDKAVQVKDSLAEALDAITMEGAEEIEAKPPIGKDPEPDYSKYDEENASHIPLKAPDIPTSLGGDEDKPDSNGLVYVSATFTVDPDKYVSNNYRPTNVAQAPDAAALLKKRGAAMKSKTVNPQEEAALSDLGTPEAKESAASPDEPTPQQEEAAAKDADKEQKEEIEVEVKEEAASVIPTPRKDEKPAQDEAPEKVVLDYATFYDGSSFICYDEVSDIDYSKIAMDAGPKKAPTRANCQTTFAQCRAKNPLFCRFHGPKLLEADIKTAIKATVGSGCVVQVTKDKNSKNKFTFRLTVGCPPSKKKMVEKMVHMYLTQNPGITSSTEDWNLVGKHKQTQEFEMDILQADNPPKKDTKADQALADTKKAIKAHKKQEVVGETAPALEKKAAKGEKWASVDDAVENEWADLVDKSVHKSLLGNNEEFLDNFDKIAEQFDAAHDAGDAEGLKEALDALKAEIGKYDEETGEKKPEAESAASATPEKTEYPKPKNFKGAEVKDPPLKAGGVTPEENEQPDGDGSSWKDDMEMEQHLETGNEEMKPEDLQNFAEIHDAIKKAGKGIGIPLNEDDYKIIPTDGGFKFKGGGVFKDSPDLQSAVHGAIKGLGFDGKGYGQVMDFTDAKGGEGGFTPPDPQEDPNFYEAWNDYNEPMLKEEFEEAKASVPEGIGNDKIDPLISAFEKAIKGYDYDSAKKAINGLKRLGQEGDGHTVLPSPNSTIGQNPQGKSPAMKDVMTALAGINGIVSDYNISYDATNANDPTEIKISAYGDGDFDDMLNKVDSHLSNVGYGVTADENGMHIVKKGEEGESGTPQYGGEAISSLQNELSGLMDKMQSLGATTDEDVFAMQHMCNYHMDELSQAKKALDEIDAKIKEASDSIEGPLGDTAVAILEASKGKAQAELDDKIAQMKGSIKQFTDSLQSYENATMETAKNGAADAVEEAIKNLGVYVYGGKRPPQGVDSVTDYLDYMKEEMESDGETNLSPDEMSDIEDQYHLEDAYNATKAASKAMDDAIAAFKDKMDEIPSQGEDNGTYQSDIEQLKNSILSASGELMANFAAYKQALEKCKYEAMAVNKLAESKKALAGGASSQGASSGGEVTKADIEDFFGQTFDENDSGEKGSLDLWTELANKGTMYGNSPSHYFDSMGGWLQGLMKHKGADHPMTKALVKAGLNLPKGMEQSSQGGEEKKPVKPFDFNAWQKGQKQGGASQEPQAPQKSSLTDEEKKAKIAAMSPKQKVEAAVKIFKKKLSANPNDADAKAKLAKYEAMLAKLGK